MAAPLALLCLVPVPAAPDTAGAGGGGQHGPALGRDRGGYLYRRSAGVARRHDTGGGVIN